MLGTCPDALQTPPAAPTAHSHPNASLEIVAHTLTSDRLRLRRWRVSDRIPFRAMNADPRVMEFLHKPLTPEESDHMVDWIEAHFDQHGFGLFAAELRPTRRFIGFIGLAIPTFVAPFTPCVEIGWRLAHDHWGHGLATEGARAVLRHAFESVGLTNLVSITVPANLRSRRVMESIGMVRDTTADFEHPRLPAGHPLRPHVLYRIDRETWKLRL
jgi:RimJ/RimL family protein N-acetyltransferase